MMPDDSERDPALHRHLVLLRRHEPTSPAFTDRVVRETVADVVSQTAERLVQEEIERIRTGS